MDPFLQEIEYCLSLHESMAFAVEMKHIEPLRQLIVFVNTVFRKINQDIASHAINIECLSLLAESQTIVKLVIETCALKQRVDQNAMEKAVKQLVSWQKLKLLFIAFLRRFTRSNEDGISNESGAFVEFIKNWDKASYQSVEDRREWKEWLCPNRKIFEFLHGIGDNKVFMKIWIAKRQQITDDRACTWTLNQYLQLLYLKARK
eukprot:143114_1